MVNIVFIVGPCALWICRRARVVGTTAARPDRCRRHVEWSMFPAVADSGLLPVARVRRRTPGRLASRARWAGGVHLRGLRINVRPRHPIP